MKRSLPLLFTLVLLVGRPTSLPAGEKWIDLKPRNTTGQNLSLAVELDRPHGVYLDGDSLSFSVTASRDCQLVAVYESAGRAVCLFPNKYHPDGQIRANVKTQIPASDDNFEFRCCAPFGKGTLRVMAATDLVTKVGCKADLAEHAVTEITDDHIKAVEVVLRQQPVHASAEVLLAVTTAARPLAGQAGTSPVSSRQQQQFDVGHRFETPSRPSVEPRRFLLIVSVEKFQSPGVPCLRHATRDSRRFHRSMVRHGGFDEIVVLENQDATRHGIEKAITQWLPKATQPGDTVVIYINSHGGRTADQDGDEIDGCDEYVVTFDGVLGRPETMILDDVLATWLRALRLRNVALILDNCYSAGSFKSVDGTPKSVDRNRPVADQPRSASHDFADYARGELPEIDVLAASGPDQMAWEVPTGEVGSVMTYFLVKAIESGAADLDRDGQVRLSELHESIWQDVESFVMATFQARQTPCLLERSSRAVIICP